jgi:hypothetical protein
MPYFGCQNCAVWASRTILSKAKLYLSRTSTVATNAVAPPSLERSNIAKASAITKWKNQPGTHAPAFIVSFCKSCSQWHKRRNSRETAAPALAIVNEAQSPEVVHEVANPRPGFA